MQTQLTETLEVKRGGYAQYFIYLAILIFLAGVNSVLKIEPPYLYYVMMAVVVCAVLSMNTLTALVFRKAVIRAGKEGVWTNKLNLVPWKEVKNIRVDRTSTFNTGNMTSSNMTELIIETTDERESVFWCEFLNTDAELLRSSLSNYWKANK